MFQGPEGENEAEETTAANTKPAKPEVTRPRPGQVWKAGTETVNQAKEAREEALTQANESLQDKINLAKEAAEAKTNFAKNAGDMRITTATLDVNDKEAEVERIKAELAKAEAALSESRKTLKATAKEVRKDIAETKYHAGIETTVTISQAHEEYFEKRAAAYENYDEATSARRKAFTDAVIGRIDYDVRTVADTTIRVSGGVAGATTHVAKSLADVAKEGYQEGYDKTDAGIGPNSPKRIQKQEGPKPPSAG